MWTGDAHAFMDKRLASVADVMHEALSKHDTDVFCWAEWSYAMQEGILDANRVHERARGPFRGHGVAGLTRASGPALRPTAKTHEHTQALAVSRGLADQLRQAKALRFLANQSHCRQETAHHGRRG